MKFAPRHLLFGLCLSLVGAGPAHQGEQLEMDDSQAEVGSPRATPALAVEEDGRLSLEAAGRRFEFAAGQVAVSVGVSSWTYRFQGSRGGIRALSISSMPERTAPGSLEYRHAGGIVERYLVGSRGVEQQFLLPGPCSGGDVLLTGSVQTDLVPEVASSFEGIRFRREDSTALFYGAAKARDAGGRMALLEERWSQGELSIVVPASFLAAARFPVLVDPFIGYQNPVDQDVDLAQNPAVATNGGTQALVVWSSNTNTIRGRVVDARSNTIFGPAAVIDEYSGDTQSYRQPRVAYSPSDAVWVVAAWSSPSFHPFIQVNKVAANLTKTTGATLDASTGNNTERDVDVACNNSGQCLIVWAWDAFNEGGTDSIKAVFYTPGTNTAGPLFDITLEAGNSRTHPRVASNGLDYYVVVEQNITAVLGFSVTTGGSISVDNPPQTGTTFKSPEVSYNAQLNYYLVVWDDERYVRGARLTGATPPVGSADVQIADNSTSPELTSQSYAGWSLAKFNSSGEAPTLGLVRPADSRLRGLWPLPVQLRAFLRRGPLLQRPRPRRLRGRDRLRFG